MPPRARQVLIAGVAATAVLVLGLVFAWAALRGTHTATTSQQLPVAGASSDSPSPVVSDSPSPSPTAADSPTPSPTPAAPKKVAPTRRPVQVAQKPPTHPPVVPPGAPGAACSPKFSGPVAAKADVAAAISAAAARTYRPILSNNDANPPAITLRLNLVQAIAWEESGWQSTIMGCDGIGLGTMQLSPDTASWMNKNYGTNYDVKSLTGNINLGAEYLAWLVRYFGDVYFGGNYSLAGDPNKVVLLDAVIAAYQAGYGNVDTTGGLVIPNRWYTDTVEGFMVSQPWAASG